MGGTNTRRRFGISKCPHFENELLELRREGASLGYVFGVMLRAAASSRHTPPLWASGQRRWGTVTQDELRLELKVYNVVVYLLLHRLRVSHTIAL